MPSVEAGCWFGEALKKAGVEVLTPMHFGNAEVLPNGVSIYWVKNPQNNEMASRLIQAAELKGYLCKEADRAVVDGAQINLMFGLNPTQPLSKPDTEASPPSPA